MNEFSEITIETGRTNIHVGKTYIAFSDNADGSDFVFDQQKAYIGFAVSTELPTDKSQFIWKKVGEGGSGGGTSGGTDERFKQLVERTITDVSDDALTSVGDYGFNGCTKLRSANFPLATIVGNYAFQNCTALTGIEMPLATSIGKTSFNGCSKLTSVNMPLVTSIGDNSFGGCTALKSIEMPLVTSMGSNAFYSCHSLTSVNMPFLKSISNSLFSSCSKLTSADFPIVKSIGSSAFSGSNNLTILILRSETLCTLGSTNVFGNTPFASGKAGGTLLVPSALVESYKTATNWSVIWGYGHNRFLALEDYTVDGTITGEIDWDKLNGGAA